jgi:hypothetical protein
MTPNEPTQSAPPVGPPQPPKDSVVWPFLRATGISLAVGGVCFWLVQANLGQTRGATRSCKLKWEQRQSQVDEAIRADEARSAEAQPQ